MDIITHQVPAVTTSVSAGAVLQMNSGPRVDPLPADHLMKAQSFAAPADQYIQPQLHAGFGLSSLNSPSYL